MAIAAAQHRTGPFRSGEQHRVAIEYAQHGSGSIREQKITTLRRQADAIADLLPGINAAGAELFSQRRERQRIARTLRGVAAPDRQGRLGIHLHLQALVHPLRAQAGAAQFTLDGDHQLEWRIEASPEHGLEP